MAKPRTKRFVVRVSTEEHAALSAKAKAAGMSASKLVRDHLNRVRVYNHAEKEVWLRAVVAMNNGAAAFARAAAILKPTDAVMAFAHLAAIRRQLEEVVKQFPKHARENFQSRHGGQ